MRFVCARTPAICLLEDSCTQPEGACVPDLSDVRFDLQPARRKHRAGRAHAFASVSLASRPAVHVAAITARRISGFEHSDKAAPQELQYLPFGVKQGGSTLRYVWNGECVQAMDEESLENGGSMAGSQLKQWISAKQDSLYKSFIPRTKDVTPDFWGWLPWRLCERFFSSTIQNLSTQSMLMALGLGAKRTIAASAAINWLLKDGVGRIARMTVATNFCQSFDSDLKRIRFTTALIFQSTIGCEFLTPFYPQHFLALASIANIGKAISLAAFVAVQPAFQRSLCIGGNLADLTAKNQAQHMVVDMVALGVSAGAMFVVRNHQQGRIMMPLLAFPVLAAADIWATYNELKAIELKTLNRERAEMVAETWMLSGRIPTAAQVSQEEHLLLPPDIGGGFMPLSITSIDRLITKPQDAQKLLRRYNNELYMMNVVMPSKPSASSDGGGTWDMPRLPWQQLPQPQVKVSLSEDATSQDILKAVLEAAYLRHALRNRLEEKLGKAGSQYQTADSQPGNGHMASSSAGHSAAPCMPGDRLWAAAGQLLTQQELDTLVQDARQRAGKGVQRFNEDLQAQGWKTRTILLSTSEKVRYVKLSKSASK